MIVKNNIEQLIEFCERFHCYLTDWEENFIVSIKLQYLERRHLTDKQEIALNKIVIRLTDKL